MAWPDGLSFAVLVSANAEWAAVKSAFPPTPMEHSPYGEYFFRLVGHERLLFFHGGSAHGPAALSQHSVNDHFQPAYLINIEPPACLEAQVRHFDVLVPDKPV